MRFEANSVGIRERKLVSLKNANTAELALQVSGSGERLDTLHGLTRVRESTLGAVGNVLGGAGEMLTGKFIKGGARVGQGVLDALDIVPSAAADGIRMVTGPDSPPGKSRYNYNISRAFGSFEEINRPIEAVGAVADVVHASVFKLGSDALKAIRNN